MKSNTAPSTLLASARDYAPGLALSVLIAIAAMFLEAQDLGPALMIALIMGISASFWTGNPTVIPGAHFAGKHLLAFGVALLGIRLSVQDIIAVGAGPALVIIIAMTATIGTSYTLARVIGLSGRVGILSGVGTAVCGASAALATASVFPRDKDTERDTSLVVVTVVAISAVAMIVYPLLAMALGLSDIQAGVVLGASIHNVPQAVAAGFTFSDIAGDIATLAKLFRVSLLAPIIIVVSMVMASQSAATHKQVGVPWFVIVFALLVVMGSLIEVPATLRQTTLEVSNWLLLVAIAAIGMSTSLASLRTVGPKVVLLIVVNSLVLLGILIGAVLLRFV